MPNYSTALMVGVLVITGCGEPTTTKARLPKTYRPPVRTGSTLEQTAQVVGEIIGVDPDRIKAGTTLHDLGCDELDYVEILMDLEENFDITISDEVADGLYGSKSWRRGMKNITMQKLATKMDELKQQAQETK